MNNTATNTATCPTVQEADWQDQLSSVSISARPPKETMEDKIKRLLREESAKCDFFCEFDEKSPDFSSLARPRKAYLFPAALASAFDIQGFRS